MNRADQHRHTRSFRARRAPHQASRPPGSMLFTCAKDAAAENSRPAQRGLRRPQIGALHAALAHATRSTDPATIVMPTGTGKTETMLALNANQRFERLLVVVPTDALREQIAGKFETFGVLTAEMPR
jgi:superfamily II DNA or RNA helicase